MNILNFMDQIMQYDGVAVECDDIKIDYKKLIRDIYDKANIIYQNDMNGKNIFISNKLSYQWIVEYLATILAGATVVIAEEYIRPKIREEIEVYDIEAIEKVSEETKTDFSDIEYKISTIIYTSGTTSLPKPVLLSCDSIFSDIAHCSNVIDSEVIENAYNTIPILPIFHMFGITANVLTPLYLGIRLCLVDDIKNLDKAFIKYKPGIMFFVPMIAKGILKKINFISKTQGLDKKQVAAKIFGGNLRNIICGGASLGGDVIESYRKLGINLLNGYGITECSPVVSCASKRSPLGSVGKVNVDEYCKVKIEDGLIKIKGNIVMNGYGRDNVESQIDSEGWFNTMDNGYIDDDNNLFITGRDSNLIVLDDGNNISPEELELMLESFEEVKEALIHDEKLGKNQVLVAELVLEESYQNIDKMNLKDIIGHEIEELNSKLPNYKKIRKFNLRLEDFKKNRLGKIIRKEVVHG